MTTKDTTADKLVSSIRKTKAGATAATTTTTAPKTAAKKTAAKKTAAKKTPSKAPSQKKVLMDTFQSSGRVWPD